MISDFQRVAKPGLLVYETWPLSRSKEGETLRAVEAGAGTGFFEAFQTVEIPSPAERKHIAAVLAENSPSLTY